MKKRFISKKKKNIKKVKILFFFMLFILGLVLSFKLLSHSNIKIDDKLLVELLIYESKFKESNTLEKIKLVFKEDLFSLNMLLENNYDGFSRVNSKVDENLSEEVFLKEEKLPLIYIYNSHQTEQYSPSTFAEVSVNPTVMMADYILEEVFNNNGLYTLVEEASIKTLLNSNKWNYARSYMASRLLLVAAKKNNPSLKYFIDVHRDSLSKDKTTVKIGEKSFAKTIFLIGLENENYLENLEFTEKINNKMNEKYPGLSKGIYKKGGEGVNGVYNQDFSKYAILLEIGGVDNTTDEVLNSSLAFAECFMEVINNIEV